ncbi:hypothetical protein FRC02_012377 [Tulasnella sp. 418]|nr:hypothetical protein FRC02_012377 [Tulasnella sp. 418]
MSTHMMAVNAIIPSTDDVEIFQPGLNLVIRDNNGRLLRPRNSFVLFRSAFVQMAQREGMNLESRHVNTIVTTLWNTLDAQHKHEWEELAVLEKHNYSLVMHQS